MAVSHYVLILLVQASVSLGGKILMFPFSHGFNTRMEDMATMATVLMDKGHSVTVIINMEDGQIFEKKSPGVSLSEFPAPGDVPR